MRSYAPEYDLLEATDLGAALDLMAAEQAWRPIAGGTDLMVLFNAGKLPYRRLVSIRKITELSKIEISPETVAIGAATTYSRIRRHELLNEEFPLLCEAAGWTGGAATQNRGTLGGNIMNASPAADSPPALLVYDAELMLQSKLGLRRIPYRHFHTGYKEMQAAPGELLCHIELARPRRHLRHYGRKVGARQAQAISKVCFAGVAEMNGRIVREVRIALGSVAPVPLRCREVENALLGQTLNAALIEEARRILADEIQPINDIRSTAEYRRLVSQNLLGEFLGGLL